MKKEITKYISKSHGKVIRISLYPEGESERELHTAMYEVLRNSYCVVGCGFYGTSAYVDIKS